MPDGLSQQTIDRLSQLFARHRQITEVILYGSRAKGNFSEGSDIDLTIKGESLDFTLLQQLNREIDDLLLPWMVDLSLFESLKNEALIDHIQRMGISIYRKQQP
ncbi:nucleotidyltransferase domain-containing protein [Mangrovibacterium marinum]|uniref:Nucleotidyltransferase-like protein n=1 Tax=Mangrovibacterium marinum TaxID=1639118 RepID=A0A2T5C072_9BACT|nr:nucleotidyltransferase domain-containing protein [Mangrovibacterium marinum]PTN07968.1 nucleotidyltransferase-like protein [Mangrovibacterium marinum]